MPKHITSSDRSSLIRLASSLEKGSAERRAILAGLARLKKHASSPYPEWNEHTDDWDYRGWTEVEHDMSMEAPAWLKRGTLVIIDTTRFTPQVWEYHERVSNVRQAEKIVEQALKAASYDVESLDEDEWEQVY